MVPDVAEAHILKSYGAFLTTVTPKHHVSTPLAIMKTLAVFIHTPPHKVRQLSDRLSGGIPSF